MDEALLHELLSGRRQDVASALCRSALYLASHGYSAAMTVRNLAYNHHWFHAERVPVPVISLGNITTGGTGKTPMAAWLANWLVARECRPGLLSRGYRSLASSDETAGGNDEKMVLDRLCPGIPHLQQRDRVKSSHRLVEESGCNVLILDDGFQHRRLSRDLDLLLIDALQPWGYGYVLPRGLLREPKHEICRADLVMITRADQCCQADRQHLKDEIAALRGTSDCVEIAFTPQRLISLDGTALAVDHCKGLMATAFCGIGNPGGFRQTLASLGVTNELTVFPDHHHYQATDLNAVSGVARAASAEIVLTTLKDLVKIPVNSWPGPPLYAVEIGVEFRAGRELLIDRLQCLLGGI